MIGDGLSSGSARLISWRSAVTATIADDWSVNWLTEPITSLRCFNLPAGPGSRHLYSQTSAPRMRDARIRLPFCIKFSFEANGELKVRCDACQKQACGLEHESLCCIRLLRRHKWTYGKHIIWEEQAQIKVMLPLCCGDKLPHPFSTEI